MRIAGSLGDQDTALLAAQKWAGENPHDMRRQISVIDALGMVARHGDAAALSKTLQDDPQAAADGYYLEGAFRARMGETQKALDLFRRALAHNPTHAPVWEQICLLKGYRDRDADIAAMEQLRAKSSAPAFQITILYALGRAYDEADEIDKAFACISEGAKRRQQLAPYDVQPQLSYMALLASTFTKQLIASLRTDNQDNQSAFIIGAPRSGSTLVEQILATSPCVAPTGEHSLLRLATARLGSMHPQEMAQAAKYPPGDWARMASTYRMNIRRRFGASQFYTDKTLINHFFAGIIAILFPQSKMIWCQRDPRDVAWSCFRSRINGNQWAQDMGNTARFILGYNKLCDHWAEILDGSLHVLSYEELVTEPEGATDALFGNLKIERPADWADFHKSANPVATASLAQIREPLNTKATGSWRRYEKHLAADYDKYFG